MLYFTPNTKLRGILNYLSKSKILYERSVTAIGSSTIWGSASSILNLKSDKSIGDNCWCSGNSANQYVDIEFKTHYLKVKAFSIKTHFINSNYIFNKFSLQGYNSTNSFVDIYTHDGTKVAPTAISLFTCQKIETFNHFRLKLLSQTSNPEAWHFILGAIEFFGYIEDLYPNHTCKIKTQIHNRIFISLIILFHK